jgi:hypothetical protein
MQLWFRAALALLLVCAGCATYREDLYRGQRLYEQNQYEKALAIWRMLEPDTDSLHVSDQTRYAYLRGMTDYRLGFRADSRYWLGLAKASEAQHPGGLSAEWHQRLDESLEDLNKDIYGGAERFDQSRSSYEERTKGVEEESTKPKNGKCYANSDCPPEHMCDQGQCIKL